MVMLIYGNCVLAASNGDNFFSRSTDDAEKQGDDDHKNVLLYLNEHKKPAFVFSRLMQLYLYLH